MRLKRLTLHGFKTFADKTEIQFSPGVTAIVGPNGSGKSNLLDALQWCLGEQKASNLRATRSQDVIFAGSSRRKPVGMAEVSLTVDNEDRFLPLDFSEVTITRRVYRSGEGEYLLNKVPCRLKDITDLFLDTGVGKGAYAIVNQSEIDSILSARPEDRRELFEEAAGIKKYRVKKREATRKLETTEQNLLRVRDIVGEVAAQREPLKAQAEVAQKYEALTTRLRAVEVSQLAWDYKRYSDEIAELAASVQAAQTEAGDLQKNAQDWETTAGGLGEKIDALEADMDKARLTQQAAVSDSQRAESRLALSRERKENALRAAETVQTDLAALQAEKARQQAEAETHEKAAQAAEGRVSEVARALAETQSDAQAANQTLSELSRTLAGADADYLELARRLSAQKAELSAVRARVARWQTDVTEAQARQKSRDDEAETSKSAEAEAAQVLQTAQAAWDMARRSLSEHAEPERQKTREREARLADARVSHERRMTEQAARLRVLEETEAAQEGYFGGVRAVMRAAQTGDLAGNYTLVADALRVPAELDTAIEVALGASLQDIITPTEEGAKAAIAHLKNTRSGRATFLPLDALRSVEVPGTLRSAARQFAGVLGSGADLVDFDETFGAAVRVLLARVLLVDNIDTATRVSRQIRDWAKIVTLTGEVVVPSGAITGGTQGGRQGPNLLGRKREIAELSQTLQTQKQVLDQMRSDEEAAKMASEAARANLREAEATVSRARESHRDAERTLQNKQNETVRLLRETETGRTRLQALEQSGKSDIARETTLSEALAKSDGQDDGAQTTRETLKSRQAALVIRRDEAQQAAQTLGSELARFRERVRSLGREAERAREAALRAQVTAEERQTRAQTAQSVVQTEDAQIPQWETERERAKKAADAAAGQLARLRETRQSLVSENFQLSERIKAAQKAEAKAMETIGQARLRTARVETQSEIVTARLMDEYEMHPDSAVALTGGEPPARDVAQEISKLRRDIKALGNVNTGATEEYERLNERWDFLTTQQNDLTDAKNRLQAAIAEIDQSTKGVFEKTFRAVQTAFSAQFFRLFGGGEAELILTNPDDVLETGVDIWAQPPGKKRQKLSLLSGGERALTATALLFAFLHVRPAPFCVLDEVDAPLDGANVEKFADLLRDFGKTSQFIVITHNATTMEAAPLWFGITMQEPGVSRGLSLKVPEITSDGSDGADPSD